MLRAGELDLHPTYFETVTAMAFLLFARQHVDTVVLEVGTGRPPGCHQCRNPRALRHHTHRLRSPVLPRRHAREDRGGKGGHPETRRAGHLRRAATRSRSRPARSRARTIHAVARLGHHGSQHRLPAAVASACAAWKSSARWPDEHQVENARTAAIALNHLGVSPAGIAQTRLGREGWNSISRHPEIILDGAHNPAGARALGGLHPSILLRPPHLDGLRRDARQSRRRNDRRCCFPWPIA